MPGCSVATCRNRNRTTKGSGVIYHCFPKDPHLVRVWTHKCHRADKFSFKTARICSIHFDSDSYIRDLQGELLGVPLKKTLKSNAVPSVHLPFAKQDSNSAAANRSSRKVRRDLLKQAKSIVAQEVVSVNDDFQLENSHPDDTKANSLLNGNERLIESNEKFLPCDKISCENIRTINEARIQKLEKRLQLKEKRISYLDNRLRKVKTQKNLLRTNVKTLKSSKVESKCVVKRELQRILGTIFTPTQIARLTSRKRNRWGTEDIVSALTIRALSMKTYLHLKDVIGIPLPSNTTLERRTKDIKCNPGILFEVLNLLKAKAPTMEPRDRVCVISFDEMKVDGRVCDDHSQDEIKGPHKSVQVVLIRGLFSGWKQIVYYDFDKNMHLQLLNEIIVNLETSGYKVVAIVSDICCTNQRLWNELAISIINTSFLNPCDSTRRIYVFANVPHLMKLLRNHFIDPGLVVENDFLTKELIEDLLREDNGELKFTKLTNNHLEGTGNERQRVVTSLQLFSHSTANAILNFFPHKSPAADFFQLVNDFFDVMNSRHVVEEFNKLRSAYGNCIEDQQNILNRMLHTIEVMRVKGKSFLLPFQQGIIISIKSLLAMYDSDFLVSLGVSYVLTSRLNLDALENIFSQLRGMSVFHSHPLPTDVKATLRLMLLGATCHHSDQTNISPDESSSNTMLTAALFDSQNIRDEDQVSVQINEFDSEDTDVKVEPNIYGAEITKTQFENIECEQSASGFDIE